MGGRLYVIIPAYNEAANIERTLGEWYPVVRKYGLEDGRLVIVDDGSTDGTAALLASFASSHPQTVVLTQENAGHGPAVMHGYRYALAHDADYVFQTDADGQTSPVEFSRFWQLRHECDAIFGRRVARGDGPGRAFVEWVLCALLRCYFGVSLPDANAPYRLMRGELLGELFPLLPENYDLPNALITALSAYYHKRIVFLDIAFAPRQGGVNSINVRRIVRAGWKALGDFRAIRRRLDRS